MSQTCRLAAILAADVAGYSRPLGIEKPGALQAFKVIDVEVFAPIAALEEACISVQTGRHRDRHSSPMVATSVRLGGEAL